MSSQTNGTKPNEDPNNECLDSTTYIDLPTSTSFAQINIEESTASRPFSAQLTPSPQRESTSQSQREQSPSPPPSQFHRPRPSDRRRPRTSRITFSFANSFTSSTSDVESQKIDSRRSSFNDDDAMRESIGSTGSVQPEGRHERNNSARSVSSDGGSSGSGTSNILRLFNSLNNSVNNSNSNVGKAEPSSESITAANAARRHTRVTTFRRYNVGDHVLITNHELPDSCEKLVNCHGFAEWDAGEALTGEEGRGPYMYLLGRVTRVHFLENLPFYTVVRMDNGEEQRADVEYMEPITNQRNIDAAHRAALKRTTASSPVTNVRHLRSSAIRAKAIRRLHHFSDRWGRIQRKIKRQLDAFLNGNRPYSCTCRFTGVNLLVVCSFWFLFIDQLRLVYAPHSMDHEFAVVSFIIWLILVMELLFEMYIRPTDYSTLTKSENAYLPSTVRHIDNFHIITESIALAFFIPEFMCLFSPKPCGDIFPISLTRSCIKALYGPDKKHAFYGQAFLCLMRLRIFGLVRHWEKMWVNNTFVRIKDKDGNWTVQRSKGLIIPHGRLHAEKEGAMAITQSLLSEATTDTSDGNEEEDQEESGVQEVESYTDDYHLTNASKIGTALLTTNAQRGLIVIFLISLQSLVSVMVKVNGGTNQQLWTSVDLLQSNNLATNTVDNSTCAFFNQTIHDWISANIIEEGSDGRIHLHLISLDIQPLRCPFQLDPDAGIIWGQLCNEEHLTDCFNLLGADGCQEFCTLWPRYDTEKRTEYAVRRFDIRPSMTVTKNSSGVGSYSFENGTVVETEFFVEAVFNEDFSVESSILSLFFLQLGFTMFILLGLSVLRYDAGRLVLGPLRRMLKIVAAYSKNPLAPPPQRSASSYRINGDPSNKLGTFETEQLINTVTKITDLLRKCWGVAGAGIISSNLARQENGLAKIAYFNPTVPGKAVYALFAFVSIDNFKSYLHNLQGDIMILINDVAAILHEEVYRWGYEDKGQCNKNLGSAFLMVYKIGEVNEVLENRKKAEQVIFSSSSTPAIRRRFTHKRVASTGRSSSHGSRTNSSHFDRKLSSSIVDNLDLSSLPGIQAFADRALLGLLKTFASIHRDKTILNWNDDFRLGAGVRDVSVELFFGMDAGWAVEGAVGSEYKIDATYLSPHVNMASRMMSATKQYGLFLLLSQKVESLLSLNAQTTLRHIDTVTVKGSSIQQKIFTFDMKVRHDFFLYSKSDSQSDLDSERYSPAIWHNDQDLCAMRNHISDEFLDTFNKGRDEYLTGKDWKKAIELLKLADKLMCKREVDEGYSDDILNENMFSLTNIFARGDSNASNSDECNQRLAMGDGPCQRLIKYMLGFGGEAPEDWAGYRPLTSK